MDALVLVPDEEVGRRRADRLTTVLPGGQMDPGGSQHGCFQNLEAGDQTAVLAHELQ